MKKISDYTETEFVNFIHKILVINEGGSDKDLGELLMQFRQLSEHPDGTDLIFYPEDGADDSPEGITKTVKEWRRANGLPGFKEGNE
ncbi:bacteriocin immunity protein [Pseudomonas chlororaphis]|uniref:bacteriocin immunity protein n=1 Tax=Pseudomonas chlororaphis TaxID=587753 RepID=UPI000BE43A2D|nr:bacteriocin immunity protein [Pseudomonas chlororaphis]